MRPFRQWAQSHYAPIILVVSSPAAEALCQRSGLSVVDIFRPFSVTTPNGEPLRASGRRPLDLRVLLLLSPAGVDACKPVWKS